MTTAPIISPQFLPWCNAKIPKYQKGVFKTWSLERTPAINRPTPGYFLIHPNVPRGWVIKKNGKSIWMSITPMEIESHLSHINAAYGHTIIAGLGMGFALYNIAAKPEVTKITVLEKDPEIIKLLNRSADWENWLGVKEKVSLVIGDALTYKPEHQIDFLYADIWPKLGDYNALTDTIKMQNNINASLVGYWGQEWDFVSFCQKNNEFPNSVSYRRFAQKNNLPLIEQHNNMYPALCFAAVTLQIASGDKTSTRNRLFEKYEDYILQAYYTNKTDKSTLIQSLF